MYESPIEIFLSEIETNIKQEEENAVLEAIVSIDVNVDKEELIKALQYDREQYEKGYKDGWREAMNRARIPRYMPDDTVCDSYGREWIVKKVEVYDSMRGREILYHCWNPSTNDRKRLFDDEIRPENQMDGGNEE